MKMFEDYNIAPPTENDEEGSFYIEITKEDSELDGWRFKINSLKMDEDKKNDQGLMTIDYDILYPDVIPEQFESETDQRIVDTIGEAILDTLERAFKEQALHVEDENDSESDS